MQELEKILEEIERKGNIQFQSYTKPLIAVEDVIKLIRGHINDGWISVDERLPEGKTRVICQFDNGDIDCLWQDWESDEETLEYLDYLSDWLTKRVIAWRPLPEPYRPERREGE